MAKRSRMTTEAPDHDLEGTIDAVLEGGNGAKLGKKHELVITAPNFQVFETTIIGDSPLVLNKFSEKARAQMREAQTLGSQAKKGKKREPKDFDECYRQAMHVLPDGSYGIPCNSFRWALVHACSLVGFFMTDAKKSLFVLADGHETDGTPLVRITKGEPQKVEHAVRNESGVADLRARPMWAVGWQARLRIRYDADFFSPTDVGNLILRAGLQVGVGEGRAFSKKSVGMGWGSFAPEQTKEDQKS